MAMDDIGLALPREFSACFRCRRISPPALSTTGPLTNQAYMSKREAHGEGEAYPRYPPLARPDDAEKREPIPWVRLPQARSRLFIAKLRSQHTETPRRGNGMSD